MPRKGNLFIVSAPSGCGKTTIVKKVMSKVKNLERSISLTTRPLRKEEKKNLDYYFVSKAVFKNKAKKGEFLEWEKNYGYYYGTPKKHVYNLLKKGKDVILTIDVKGAAQVKRKMPECVRVFIAPPNLKELAKRLKKRARDASYEIKKRLSIAKKEISFSKKYDYTIKNDLLEDAVRRLKAIIIAKRCKR